MNGVKFIQKLVTGAFALCAAGLIVGANPMTAEAAFDAPYYNITTNGGTFDGNHYTLANGNVVKNAFFCDGTYTYFLQADGTPMKDRLTYHPDGVQIIYFDSKGHECFDTFANVKKSIAGDPVDDLCYFGTTGNLYVNVITYNRDGTSLYYANPYGVVPRSGMFEINHNAANYEALAIGKKYGYANADGSISAFYSTLEEVKEKVEGMWKLKTSRVIGKDGSLSNWYEYEYNAFGKLVSKKHFLGSGTLLEWEEHDEEKEIFYNSDGTISRENKLDKSGKRISGTSYYKGNFVLETGVYYYDEKDRLQKIIQYYPDGKISIMSEYEYEGDSERITHIYYRCGDDTVLNAWEDYVYFEDGNVEKIIQYNKNGGINMYKEYAYDLSGNTIKEITEIGSSYWYQEIVNYYDSYQNLIERKKYSEDGVYSGSEEYIWMKIIPVAK